MGIVFPIVAPMALLPRTLELLNEARAAGLSLRQIALQSEGAVDVEWLKKFARGRWSDPGVVRVQKLHDALVRRTAAQ